MEMRQIRPTSRLNEDLQPILPKAGCQAEYTHFNETYFHIKDFVKSIPELCQIFNCNLNQ